MQSLPTGKTRNEIEAYAAALTSVLTEVNNPVIRQPFFANPTTAIIHIHRTAVHNSKKNTFVVIYKRNMNSGQILREIFLYRYFLPNREQAYRKGARNKWIPMP